MTISSQTRKAGPYNGNGSTTTFPFAFKVFATSDVLVVRSDASGVETTLTLGTDYTVSLNANQDSNAGGNVVTTSAPASGYKITIGSKVPLLQQTDFTNQGGFYPKVLNASLDKLTILTQQLQEQVDRSAKLPISNPADAATLTAAILQVANDQANIDAVAGDLANIDAVKNNKTNIDTVAGISANVSTVAGISADVTAVAGNNTNITAVKNNATNINTVAGIAANVTTVAGISANVTSVAGNATNITAVAGNATNINAVAGNATNINAVNANKTNIDAVAGNATNINAVNANKTNIDTAATNIAAIIDAPNQATAAAASAAAAAASAASGMYSAVQDKSADYTIVAADAGDLIRVNTSGGARTITLPQIGSTGITDGFKIAVVKWTSGSNAVTIARSGSDTINGATSYSLGNQYSSATFVADFETNTWFAAASGLGTTNANVDVFSGNGSTTGFTLSGDAGSKNNTAVMIGGVYQAKSTYSLSGTTLTFSSAPPSGTSNIEVVWNSPLAIGTPSDDTVSTAKLQAQAVTTAKLADANVTPAKLSTGAPVWNSSSLLGIGESNPQYSVDISNSAGNLLINQTRTIVIDTERNIGGIQGGGYSTGTTKVAAANITLASSGAWSSTSTPSYIAFGTTASGSTTAAERMRIDASGNVGIGTNSPANAGYARTFVLSSIGAGAGNYNLFTLNANYGADIKWIANTTSLASIAVDSTAGANPVMMFRMGSSETERMRIDSSGNLLVGTTSSTAKFTLAGTVGSGAGVGMSATWNGDFFSYSCDAGGVNTALSGLKIQKVNSTGRSLNAAGTINASGADYAEYMRKSGDFVIAKGDVVGVNANGELTNIFAEAVSFVVKSTDPSYVGGDSWSVAEMPDPVADDASDEEKAKYAADFAQWTEAHEVERASVDRIAFAGQVPVNVLGATAGQFIVPTNDNGAIKGVAMNEDDMTLSHYMKAVGKVIAIEDDGRARIIVKVA